MKKHVAQNISNTTVRAKKDTNSHDSSEFVKNNSFQTVKHTELKQNDDQKITWSIKTQTFERLMSEVGNFQDYRTRICQNWLKARETTIFCQENIQQYRRITIVLEDIIKLTEKIKTKIQCQQFKKLEISETIKTIVSEQLEIEPHRVTPTANFANELGVDSLDRLELILALEETFSIKISAEIAGTLLTVQHLIDYLTVQLSA